MSPNIWVYGGNLLTCYKFPPWGFEAHQNFDDECNQQLDSILICHCSVAEDIKMSKEQEKSEWAIVFLNQALSLTSYYATLARSR